VFIYKWYYLDKYIIKIRFRINKKILNLLIVIFFWSVFSFKMFM
jgi:hypothetical protein